MSAPGDDRHPRDRLRRLLSLRDATLLVVSSVVGSGIFLTPGEITELLPHPLLIFAVWTVGGLLSLAGALANAELGAMYPHAGGDYVYLREAYHPLAGFLVGWLSFFVIYAGTIATLAAGFAGGLAPMLGYGEGTTLAVAIGTIVAASLLNYLGVRFGAWANNVTALLKLVALLAVGVVAPLLGTGHWENFRAIPADASFSLAAFGLALSPVLFSYLGWNASVYVASEIRDPGRNVPRSLFLGLGLCTLVYLVVNAVYLYALPVSELRGVADAGEATARALIGAAGGTVVAVFVLTSILGTLNATILVGPRIAYAMALDGLFFGGVDRVQPTYRTPSVAIWLQAGVAVGLLWALERYPGSLFANAIHYTIFAIVLATMADTAALYALRRRQPHRPRPYRAWGYPWVPALYLVANAGLAITLVVARPGQCAMGLAVAATGLPFYVLFARHAVRTPPPGAGR